MYGSASQVAVALNSACPVATPQQTVQRPRGTCACTANCSPSAPRRRTGRDSSKQPAPPRNKPRLLERPAATLNNPSTQHKLRQCCTSCGRVEQRMPWWNATTNCSTSPQSLRRHRKLLTFCPLIPNKPRLLGHPCSMGQPAATLNNPVYQREPRHRWTGFDGVEQAVVAENKVCPVQRCNRLFSAPRRQTVRRAGL